MKKNLWILLAISALIAMFVISGCQKAVTPTPTPTPTPTVAPTTAPDVDCPKVVSTDVYKTWDQSVVPDCAPCSECPGECPTPTCTPCVEPTVTGTIYSNCAGNCGEYIKTCDQSTGTFKIVITFDEKIDSLNSTCVYNAANWTIKVKNSGRITQEILATPYNVVIDGDKIIVDASVYECGSRDVMDWCSDCPGSTIAYRFCGLICNLNDAACYANTVNGLRTAAPYGLVAAPTVADEIDWELGGGCVVSDELGNYCCGFSGSDCCVEPICETCEPCPLGSSACL